MTRLTIFLSAFALMIAPAFADDDASRPFDGNYAAMAEVEAALEEARSGNKRLLLILGANWCHDSLGLASHLQDEQLARILDAHYVTRFIDVGQRDANMDVSRRFGVPALYATPTVLVIDAQTGSLLNRQERGAWTTAASRPVEEARDWFRRWAGAQPATGGLLETSLIYQAMQVEIELYEEEQANRLAQAYLDLAEWRALPAAQRPEIMAALTEEMENWRRSLPREIDALHTQARRLVAAELARRAGDGPVTVDTVAEMDAADPDLALDYAPHQSAIW